MHNSVTPVHNALITGDCVWQRDNFVNPEQWCYHLKQNTLDELDDFINQIRRSKGEITAYLSEQLDEVFPFPSFVEDGQRLKKELEVGRGFVIIKGLPLDRYTEDEADVIYARIGMFFGTTLSQSLAGEVFYAVRDEGFQIEKHGEVGARGTKSNAKLHFHTDSAPAHRGNTPDIIGLLCHRPAKSGGVSLLVNANTIHNIILQEQADYLERLYNPYHFDRRAEMRPGESSTLLAPIFSYDGGLSMRFNELYIITGHEVAGVPLSPRDTAPLSFIKRLTNREELTVRFEMQQGDMQFVNNHFILHARTAFEDFSEPARKRHLSRLWLKYLGGRRDFS